MAQIVIWNGAANPDPGGYQPGDVVDVVEDGVHLGTAVVGGEAWDSAVTNPNFVVLDVEVAGRMLRALAVQALGLPYTADHIYSLARVLSLDTSRLNAVARAALRSKGRASVPAVALAALAARKAGVSDLDLLRRFAPELEPGREPRANDNR